MCQKITNFAPNCYNAIYLHDNNLILLTNQNSKFMKKIFTLIAAAFVAVSVSAQTAKVFTETEVFLPTKDNLNAAFTAGWMVSGDMTVDPPYSANKKGSNLDPTTGETLEAAGKYEGFLVKDSKTKLITIKFKGADELVVYGVSSSSSATRTLSVTLIDSSENSTEQKASTEPNVGCSVKFSSLAKESEYSAVFKGFEGDKAGDVLVYGIKFVVSDTSGITSVENAVEADAATYNVAGQRVNANAKGLVIKNGKKYINR